MKYLRIVSIIVSVGIISGLLSDIILTNYIILFGIILCIAWLSGEYISREEKERLRRASFAGALALIICIVLMSLFWGAFAKESVEEIKSWKADNYEITLTKRLGWAGPSYYTYEVTHPLFFGLLAKKIDSKSVGRTIPEDCHIKFESGLLFDQCEIKLSELH